MEEESGEASWQQGGDCRGVQLGTAAGSLVVPREKRTFLVYFSLPLTPEYPTHEFSTKLLIDQSTPRSRYPSLSVVKKTLNCPDCMSMTTGKLRSSPTIGINRREHVAGMD